MMYSQVIIIQYIKENVSLYSLDYVEVCNEFPGPVSASLRPGSNALIEEMLQRWRSVGSTVCNLTGPLFEPQTTRSRYKRVTARHCRCNCIMMSQLTSTYFFEYKPRLLFKGGLYYFLLSYTIKRGEQTSSRQKYLYCSLQLPANTLL